MAIYRASGHVNMPQFNNEGLQWKALIKVKMVYSA